MQNVEMSLDGNCIAQAVLSLSPYHHCFSLNGGDL